VIQAENHVVLHFQQKPGGGTSKSTTFDSLTKVLINIHVLCHA
jgi:hypothetical protein